MKENKELLKHIHIVISLFNTCLACREQHLKIIRAVDCSLYSAFDYRKEYQLIEQFRKVFQIILSVLSSIFIQEV